MSDPGHPLRIALLNYRGHPHVGGQGVYVHYLSRALVELGHRVEVLSGPPYPELAAGVEFGADSLRLGRGVHAPMPTGSRSPTPPSIGLWRRRCSSTSRATRA